MPTYTAEAVRVGHPDKVCDLISDAILDAYLTADPLAHVAVEVQGGHGHLNLTGEIRSTAANIDRAAIARQVYRRIGYQDALAVDDRIAEQSPEIDAGVRRGGAGDSGIVVGYATKETPERLPLELALARRVCQALDSSQVVHFGPDGKVQVTVVNGLATRVVASVQQTAGRGLEETREQLRSIINLAIGECCNQTTVYDLNPAGQFTIGGFAADAGATGRKIVQDQYGPRIPIGGGAFSGKDATKVDRSGAYLARHVARRLVEQYNYPEVGIWISYAIGVPVPVDVQAVALKAGERIPIEAIRAVLNGRTLTELTVPEAIDLLGLRQPIFQERARQGHYGFNGL